MKRAILILGLLIVLVFTFAGCESKPDAYISICHSAYNFDNRNIYLDVEDIYETDYYNPYDWVDTENGKDLVIHYVKVKE